MIIIMFIVHDHHDHHDNIHPIMMMMVMMRIAVALQSGRLSPTYADTTHAPPSKKIHIVMMMILILMMLMILIVIVLMAITVLMAHPLYTSWLAHLAHLSEESYDCCCMTSVDNNGQPRCTILTSKVPQSSQGICMSNVKCILSYDDYQL